MEPDVIVGRLRLSKPSQLRVFEGGKDAEIIAVSTKRDRWRRCVDVLAEREWTRIDLLDAQGHTIESLRAEEDEPEDEEESGLSEIPDGHSPEFYTIINAQRLVLENHAHMLNPLIDGYIKLAEIVGARMAAMEQRVDNMLDLAYENAALKAQADAGPDMDESVVRALIDKLDGTKKLPAAKKDKSNGVTP